MYTVVYNTIWSYDITFNGNTFSSIFVLVCLALTSKQWSKHISINPLKHCSYLRILIPTVLYLLCSVHAWPIHCLNTSRAILQFHAAMLHFAKCLSLAYGHLRTGVLPTLVQYHHLHNTTCLHEDCCGNITIINDNLHGNCAKQPKSYLVTGFYLFVPWWQFCITSQNVDIMPHQNAHTSSTVKQTQKINGTS